jgi:hypothetical protein
MQLVFGEDAIPECAGTSQRIATVIVEARDRLGMSFHVIRTYE